MQLQHWNVTNCIVFYFRPTVTILVISLSPLTNSLSKAICNSCWTRQVILWLFLFAYFTDDLCKWAAMSVTVWRRKKTSHSYTALTFFYPHTVPKDILKLCIKKNKSVTAGATSMVSVYPLFTCIRLRNQTLHPPHPR